MTSRARFAGFLIVLLIPITVGAQPTSESQRSQASMPPDFGTQQGTARLAASAPPMIDIVGIKLGMPAHTAIDRLKSVVPGAAIELLKTRDYETAFLQKRQEDPKNRWVMSLKAQNDAEQIALGIAYPPSAPFVVSIGRSARFPQPVALENVINGMRQKYGKETVGPDYRLGGFPMFDVGGNKTFIWAWTVEGRLLSVSELKGLSADFCRNQLQITSDMGKSSPAARPAGFTGRSPNDWRLYEMGSPQLRAEPCRNLIMMIANVFGNPGAPQLASAVEVVAYHWPLIVSESNAMYSLIDTRHKAVQEKATKDSKERKVVF